MVLSKFENYKMLYTRDSTKLVVGKSCLRYCRVGQLLKGADLQDSPLRREASTYLLEVFIEEKAIVLIEHNVDVRFIAVTERCVLIQF